MPHLIRALAESKSQENALDANTNKPLFWWRGSDLEIQIALSRAGVFLLSADIGTVTVEVKKQDARPTQPALMRKVYGAADCDLSFVADDWQHGQKQLFTAIFTDEEAALDAGVYRLIVKHNAPNGAKDTFLSSLIRVVENHSGAASLVTPPPTDATYLDEAESDARYASNADIADLQNQIDNLDHTDVDLSVVGQVTITDTDGDSVTLPTTPPQGGLVRVNDTLEHTDAAGNVQNIDLSDLANPSTGQAARIAYLSTPATLADGNTAGNALPQRPTWANIGIFALSSGLDDPGNDGNTVAVTSTVKSLGVTYASGGVVSTGTTSLILPTTGNVEVNIGTGSESNGSVLLLGYTAAEII